MGYTEVSQSGVHGADDQGRGVEGGKGGALGAGVILRRQEGLKFVPELLPAGVFILAGHRVGEDAQSHRAEAGETGEHNTLLGGRGPLGLLDGLQRADRRQEGASVGFRTAGEGRCWGALRRQLLGHGAVARGLAEVHVVAMAHVWYGREGHGASPV